MTGGVDCFIPFAMTMCVERHCERVIIKGNRGNDLPLPPPKGDKSGINIPLWRGAGGIRKVNGQVLSPFGGGQGEVILKYL